MILIICTLLFFFFLRGWEGFHYLFNPLKVFFSQAVSVTFSFSNSTYTHSLGCFIYHLYARIPNWNLYYRPLWIWHACMQFNMCNMEFIIFSVYCDLFLLSLSQVLYLTLFCKPNHFIRLSKFKWCISLLFLLPVYFCYHSLFCMSISTTLVQILSISQLYFSSTLLP